MTEAPLISPTLFLSKHPADHQVTSHSRSAKEKMLRYVVVLAALLAVTLANPTTESATASATAKTLWETIREKGYNRFVDLAIKSGVFQTVTEQGKYTLFVPTDAAFERFQREFPAPADIDDKRLLSYHIVPAERYTRDFVNEELMATSTGQSPVTDLRINRYSTFDGQTPFWTVNGVNVTLADQSATNGVYHVIDQVLYPIPTGNIMDTLKTTTKYNVQSFYKSLVDQGLETELSKTTPYTIFVPISSVARSVDSLSSTTVATPIVSGTTTETTDVLKYIFPGTYFTNGFSYDKPIQDKTGRSLKFESTPSGELKINGSLLVGSEIPTTNGVIHFLDNDYMY